MEETAFELMKLVREVSPQLWQIALRQVVVERTQFLIFSFGLFMCALVVTALIRGLKENKDMDVEDRNGLVLLLAFTRTVFLVPLAVLFAMMAMERFINPDFYAIQVLTSLFLK